MPSARQVALNDAKIKVKFFKEEKKKLPKLTKEDEQHYTPNAQAHDEIENSIDDKEDLIKRLSEMTDLEYQELNQSDEQQDKYEVGGIEDFDDDLDIDEDY